MNRITEFSMMIFCIVLLVAVIAVGVGPVIGRGTHIGFSWPVSATYLFGGSSTTLGHFTTGG
jgi:hypothetical protein